MQETDPRVIPDPYKLVQDHLFSFLKKIDVLPSLEANHLSPFKFTDSDSSWLQDNNYEVVTLPGNSIKYWWREEKRII